MRLSLFFYELDDGVKARKHKMASEIKARLQWSEQARTYTCNRHLLLIAYLPPALDRQTNREREREKADRQTELYQQAGVIKCSWGLHAHVHYHTHIYM